MQKIKEPIKLSYISSNLTEQKKELFEIKEKEEFIFGKKDFKKFEKSLNEEDSELFKKNCIKIELQGFVKIIKK